MGVVIPYFGSWSKHTPRTCFKPNLLSSILIVGGKIVPSMPPLQHMHTYITTELLVLWLHFDIFVSFLLLSLSLAGSFASTLSVKPHQDTAQLSREIEHGCSDLVSFMKTRSAWFQVWLVRLYFWHYRKPVTAIIYHQWVKLNALQFYRVYVI